MSRITECAPCQMGEHHRHYRVVQAVPKGMMGGELIRRWRSSLRCFVRPSPAGESTMAPSTGEYEVWAIEWTGDEPQLRSRYARQFDAEVHAERIARASTLSKETGAVSVWIEDAGGNVVWAAGLKAAENSTPRKERTRPTKNAPTRRSRALPAVKGVAGALPGDERTAERDAIAQAISAALGELAQHDPDDIKWNPITRTIASPMAVGGFIADAVLRATPVSQLPGEPCPLIAELESAAKTAEKMGYSGGLWQRAADALRAAYAAEREK